MERGNEIFRTKIITYHFKLALIALILAGILPLPGCGQSRQDIHNDELEHNIGLWKEKGIKNYNFVITQITLGNTSWMPILLKVRNNRVILKEEVSKSGPMTKVDSFEDFETVEKAFSTIQNAYAKKFWIDVRYNKEFGYPERIRVDRNPNATDQVVTTDFSNFEVVED